MTFIINLPLFSIVLSLFSGVLCFLLPGRAARRYTIAYECLLLIMAVLVLRYTMGYGAFTYVMGEFPAPWGNEIRAGILEALLATVFLMIMICAVTAGKRYVKVDVDASKINLYYALINLMTAALMALIWTNDIFTGYVFLEILTLTSCGILIVREIGRTTLAAVRYMILNLLGSGLFLLGVVLLYNITGNLLMVPMQEQVAILARHPDHILTLTLSLAILTMGLGIKSGLFPFHYWMPDTYGWATPTSAAILSALVSKAYIFLLFKIFYRVIGIGVFDRLPLKNVLFVLGILGMVFGSISAIRAKNINHMVAFSSAAQIGYIYMGIGVGGIAGCTAAMFQIIAHALTKSLLFLTTPRLAEVSGNSLKFRDLQGSGLRDKSAGYFFLFGALSMIGIPIFAGFSAKLLFALAGVDSGSGKKLFLVMMALAVSSLLNAMYFIRTAIRIFTEPQNREVPKSGEHAKDQQTGERKTRGIKADYVLPMTVLTAANLFLGLFSWVIVDLIQRGLAMFG